jgi:lipopolysaccharide assembly outer membrane protein LptD (OstA)
LFSSNRKISARVAISLVWLTFLGVGFEAFSQVLAPKRLSTPVFLDSMKRATPVVPKVISAVGINADSTQTDSLQSDSDLKSTVKYSAQDSTVMDPGQQEVHLYGKANVTYGAIILDADYIRLNWKTNEVFARGNYDSTAKKWIGQPIFQDNGEKYDTKELRYNFKSKKGFIKGIVTQQGDGNIRGTTVKKDEENNMYVRGSIYTTCNLAQPHFHIAARKIKVIPEKQVISGPFHLVIADVPLPLGLPFGFFPVPKKKEIGTSGIIMPQYGEEPNGRGYYLRDGGYYWAISEKINMNFTGQIYSKGSWGLGIASTYAQKYRYSGSFNARFNRNLQGNEVKALNRPRNDFSLTWSHAPVPRGTSSFGASVNIGSNSFNQFNEFSTTRYIQNVASSSVQYNKQFGQFARIGSSIRVNQRFPDRSKETRDSLGRVTNTDPGALDAGIDFNFGINQIAPFALKGGTGSWYESFRLGMDFSGGISANNTKVYADTSTARLGFSLFNPPTVVTPESGAPTTYALNSQSLPEFIKNGQLTGRFSVPISLPNIKLFRYINITPGISLSGETFTKKFKYEYMGNNKVKVDTLQGFYFANNVSFSASMNTRVYGTFFFHGKRLEAIRHTLIPSASFSYVPDQSNLFEKTVVNQRGDVRYLNRYRTIGGNLTTSGTSAAGISWSLNNLFEAKMRPKSDSTGKQFEKKSILDNLSLNGSYNLLADSLKMSDISLNANAQLFKNLNFNFSANFDPYAYVKDELYGAVGRKINRWSFTEKQGLARLNNVNVALSTRFAPKGSDKPKKANTPNTEEQQRLINANPDAYVDFNIPWTLNLSYNFGYSRQGLSKGTTIQALRVNGDFSLTPNWKFVFDTGVDVVAKAPSITNIGITRDLHCWEMSFNWTPFAGSGIRANNYSFEIRAKSALLRDLKLSRRRSFYDRGSF